ncbi:MAG TPA: hypothetical protein VFC44_02800 [Candidatus Saccharimonadales bacterium]|nr:hypothetical protein [Candidatus Saccharimonadales bacterium]
MANLVRHGQSGKYYARIRVRGKLIWKSLKTDRISVAKLRLAEPLSRLLTYLFNEANPATPEIIRGYVMSLDTTGKQLGRALDEEDVQRVKPAFDEMSQTLRRIHADLNETQHASRRSNAPGSHWHAR